MKRSILRASFGATLIAYFVVDSSVGACVIGVTCTRVGTEVFMNDLGGTCKGAGEKILSCAVSFDCVSNLFCPGLEGIEIGEPVDSCCGVPVELEEDSGNFGIADILVSSKDPGGTLLFSCVGLIEFLFVNVGVCGEVDVKLFGALFVSEKPHCGQNVACLRTSVLHRGQRVGETDAANGCGCCDGSNAEASRDD